MHQKIHLKTRSSFIKEGRREKSEKPNQQHTDDFAKKDGVQSLAENQDHKEKPEAKVKDSNNHLIQAKKPSIWVLSQLRLAEERNKQIDQPTHRTKENKNEARVDKKPNLFASKLQQHSLAAQQAQTALVMQKAINPEVVQALETKVAREPTSHQPQQPSDAKELAGQIQNTATLEIGKAILDHKKGVVVATKNLTNEQARLEVATKLQTGVVVARKMIQILESQGVKPQIARETAVEKVTQTLIKTLRDRGLDQYLQNDEEQPRVEVNKIQYQPKVTITEYINPEGHQIREKISADEFDVTTIEREEIIAERDIIADAHRVEAAMQIGKQLINKSLTGRLPAIHTREISQLMPEEPGETLSSFIRTQLNLMLDSEEQYDRFLDALAGVGYVNSEHEVTLAAKYATDLAPAVRIARKLTTEKVLPTDEQRAINKGGKPSFN